MYRMTFMSTCLTFMLRNCVFRFPSYIHLSKATKAVLKAQLAPPPHLERLCLRVTESSILRDVFPVWDSCLPTVKLLSCRCITTQDKISALSERGKELLLEPSSPTNKSPFQRTISAPWNLETTSEMHQQKVCREADKEVHTSSWWVSKLTARQEKAAED